MVGRLANSHGYLEQETDNVNQHLVNQLYLSRLTVFLVQLNITDLRHKVIILHFIVFFVYHLIQVLQHLQHSLQKLDGLTLKVRGIP